MTLNEKKLDNPVWYSLSETHKGFAIDFDNIKFYHPDYCPFGGFMEIENISNPISEYSELTDNFFTVGQKPNFSNNLKLKNELVCLQMLTHHKTDLNIEEDIVALGEEHMNDLLELVKIAYPEYFKKKTSSLGNYYGIFKNNQLVAVTGERMKMNEYVEISAVITHPNNTGNGYAKQLAAHAVKNIFNQKKTPYLHVAETNVGAIKLYIKLGFQTRRKISFWNITKNPTV
ncbi:MAG: GNAT family N-acetyltransferase [Flavobacteriaceae bacterium]|nr:GNAT family N-acetyltransferase [Flavobacteriaceae bacterium]